MTETLFLQKFDSEAVGWIFSGKFDFLEDYKIQREFCLNHIGIRKKTMIKVEILYILTKIVLYINILLEILFSKGIYI